MIPHSFWKDVENTSAMDYVLYGDTDSLYIKLSQDEEKTPEQLVEIADSVSEEINGLIKYFVESLFLPKLGVDILYNNTFFKTELVSDAIMFLDIKKNYAFRELADKGKINPEPEFKYTGIPVVKTNIAMFTKNFIRELVEQIALNSDIDKAEMKQKLNDTAKKYWAKLKEDCANYDLSDIGIPCKWSNTQYAKEPYQVIAMRTYNTICGEDVLMPSQAAISFPIKKINPSKLMDAIKTKRNRSEFCLGNINVNDINYLAVPFNTTKEQLQSLMVTHWLKIDEQQYWDILYNTVSKRIVDTIKQYIASN